MSPEVDPARRERILRNLRLASGGELPPEVANPADLDAYVAHVSADVDAGLAVPWSEDRKRRLAGLLRPYVRPAS